MTQNPQHRGHYAGSRRRRSHVYMSLLCFGTNTNRVYACVYAHIYIYIQLILHIRTYIHVCIHCWHQLFAYAYMGTCLSTYMQLSREKYLYVCIYMHVYIHIHTCTCVSYPDCGDTKSDARSHAKVFLVLL